MKKAPLGIVLILCIGFLFGETVKLSTSEDGIEGNSISFHPSVSLNGRFVAFTSYASNLVPDDFNNRGDIFVRDLKKNQIFIVSLASDGIQGNGSSFDPSLSANGRFVAFSSEASNLVDGDTSRISDIFVHDTQNLKTERVSISNESVQGNSYSYMPQISGNGRLVAFHSSATNLVPGDTNNKTDIFIHDRKRGRTSRVSIGSDGTQGNGSSTFPSISRNGRFVAFRSEATNLVQNDTNNRPDIFVYDRKKRKTTRVSIASDGSQAAWGSMSAHISANGRHVTFVSNSPDLVPGDTGFTSDIFVHDRYTGETICASVSSDGTFGGASTSGSPTLSANGKFVAYHSISSILVDNDTNNTVDIFRHNCWNGKTILVSKSSDNVQGNGSSSFPYISGNGRVIAFDSRSTNLVSGTSDALKDIYVFSLKKKK